MSPNILERIFVVLVSLVLVVSGAYKISAFLFDWSHSQIFKGIIVKEGMGRFTGCKPFIEFYDSEGLLREYKSEINYHFFFCPKRGDEIIVISHNQIPSRIYTFNVVHYILIPLILVFLGLWVAYSYFFKIALKEKAENDKHYHRP